MKIELLGHVNVYIALGIQTLTSLILGGVIGYERESKNKSAGIKTNMLICIGACIYTAVSLMNQADHIGTADPNRIAAQVVSGIGFLGAGAIIQSRGNIIGLTTAASIWVVAAIGVTVGCGYPFIAIIFTTTTLVVLKLVSPIHRLLERDKDVTPFQFKILSRGSVKKYARSTVASVGHEIDEIWEDLFDKQKNYKLLTIILSVHPRKKDQLIYELEKQFQVIKVSASPHHDKHEESDDHDSANV